MILLNILPKLNSLSEPELRQSLRDPSEIHGAISVTDFHRNDIREAIDRVLAVRISAAVKIVDDNRLANRIHDPVFGSPGLSVFVCFQKEVSCSCGRRKNLYDKYIWKYYGNINS